MTHTILIIPHPDRLSVRVLRWDEYARYPAQLVAFELDQASETELCRLERVARSVAAVLGRQRWEQSPELPF